MKSFILSCYVLFIFYYKVQCQDVKEQFEKNEIVPDIINKAPDDLIVINFPKNFVKLGNELTPTEVKSQPEVDWETSPRIFHTLIMVDPDARSRENPTLRSILHWLVVNIPGSNVTDGETKVEFAPSTPPRTTGLHRYVFLVYEQREKQDFNISYIPTNVDEGRLSFSVRDFQEKYGLNNPKYGNFYLAQWDESVKRE